MLELECTDDYCRAALARNVQRICEDREITLSELAIVSNVLTSVVFGASNGIGVLPTIAEAARMASVLSVRLEDLINPDFRLEIDRASDARKAVAALKAD